MASTRHLISGITAVLVTSVGLAYAQSTGTGSISTDGQSQVNPTPLATPADRATQSTNRDGMTSSGTNTDSRSATEPSSGTMDGTRGTTGSTMDSSSGNRDSNRGTMDGSLSSPLDPGERMGERAARADRN